MHEVVFLHSERLNILTGHINTLMSQVVMCEALYKRVEDSGLIHMAGVIRKMAKDLEMLQINHNKLSNFVRTHLKVEQEQEGSGGGDEHLPLSAHLQKSMSKLGR
jgi:hypothetical protein